MVNTWYSLLYCTGFTGVTGQRAAVGTQTVVECRHESLICLEFCRFPEGFSYCTEDVSSTVFLEVRRKVFLKELMIFSEIIWKI